MGDIKSGQVQPGQGFTTLTGKDGPIIPTDPSIRPDGLKETKGPDKVALEQKLHELSKVVAAQQTQINALTTKASAKAVAKPQIPKNAVTHNKKKYKFRMAQFRVAEHGLVTAEQAASNPDIMKHLVETNSGVIKEHFGK